jgi:hypothetical protein
MPQPMPLVCSWHVSSCVWVLMIISVPGTCSAGLTEMLLEGYTAPSVAYGVPDLFSHMHNRPEAGAIQLRWTLVPPLTSSLRYTLTNAPCSLGMWTPHSHRSCWMTCSTSNRARSVAWLREYERHAGVRGPARLDEIQSNRARWFPVFANNVQIFRSVSRPLLCGASETSWGCGRAVVGAHVYSDHHRYKLIQLKRPGLGGLTYPRIRQLVDKHTYFAADYGTELDRWADPLFARQHNVCVQMPFDADAVTAAVDSTRETAAELERRHEGNALRLKDMHRQRRQGKLQNLRPR